MKIKQMRVYPVNLTVKPEFVITTTLGTHAFSKYVFIALESDEGAVGWGEASLVPIWSGETQAGTLSLYRDVFTHFLIGRDPRDIDAIMADINASAHENNFSKAAVEMALLDLVGRSLNQPVYKLIGGDVNAHRIPIKFSIGTREPDDAAGIAAEKVAQGFRGIKVKVGRDLKKDLERVRKVREAIGSATLLNIDVNGGWSVKDAIRFIPMFCEYNLEYVEQPTARVDIDGMAEVRRASRVPIMADESVFSPEQGLEVIRKGAADMISVYPGKNGGILNSRLICKMAETAGIVCHIGSNLEWDIATAAMCHLGVATRNIPAHQYPVDILGPLYYETRLRGTPVRFEGGHVNLPEGPGLGLQVDEALIEELSHVDFLSPAMAGKDE